MTIKVQINNIVRDATQSEVAIIEEAHRQNQIAIEAALNVEAARVSAKAKLSALGLTDEEVAAIVGGV